MKSYKGVEVLLDPPSGHLKKKLYIYMGKNKSKWIVSGVRAHAFFVNTLWIHIGLLARF